MMQHPYVRQRHQRDHLCPDAEILAWPHLALADHARDRRRYAGVAQVDRCEISRGLLRCKARDALGLLAVQHIELLPLLIELRAVERNSGSRSLRVVDGLLYKLRRAGDALRKKCVLAHSLQMIASGIGFARLDLGLGLFDQCFLQAPLSDFCNKIGTTPSSSFRRGTLPRVDTTYRRQQRNSNSSGSKIRHSLKSLLGIAQRSGNHSWFHLSRRSARTTNPHELRWWR
jgi:hypothetical protein